jgi:GNAT superfamily N-acetyltransferase
MDVQIRVLGPDDDHVLTNVAPEVFDGPIDPDLTREFLQDPRHHIAVSIQNGMVIGFASAVHYVHPDKAPQLWINEVSVAPPHRRRGLGRGMLTRLFDVARTRKCTVNEDTGALALVEVVECALKEQASAPDDPHVAGELLDFSEQMTRQKDRDAVFRRKSADQFADFVDASRVESIRGFVENEEFRLREEGERNAEALPDALRERLHKPMGIAFQMNDPQHTRNAGGIQLNESLSDPKVLMSGQVRVERRRFDDGADSPQQWLPSGGTERLAEHANLSALRACEAQEHSDCGRLPGAVGPRNA